MMIKLMLLKAEIKQALILFKRYLLNSIGSILTVWLFFLGIYFGIKSFGGGFEVGGGSAEFMVGFLMWVYVVAAISTMGDGLAYLATQGCLEQIYLSPVHPVYLLGYKAIADVSVSSVQLISGMVIIMLTTGIRLSIPVLPVLLVWGLTVAGLYGFGYIYAGIVLVHKKAGQVRGLMQWSLLFFCGIVIPLAKMPHWLRVFSRTLPLSQGLQIIKMMTVYNRSLSQMPGDILLLILNSTIYLLAGIGVFLWSDRILRVRGTLTHY